MTTIIWMIGGLIVFFISMVVYMHFATWLKDDDCQHCMGLRNGIPGEELHIDDDPQFPKGLTLCIRCHNDYEEKKEDGNNTK